MVSLMNLRVDVCGSQKSMFIGDATYWPLLEDSLRMKYWENNYNGCEKEQSDANSCFDFGIPPCNVYDNSCDSLNSRVYIELTLE